MNGFCTNAAEGDRENVGLGEDKLPSEVVQEVEGKLFERQKRKGERRKEEMSITCQVDTDR